MAGGQGAVRPALADGLRSGALWFAALSLAASLGVDALAPGSSWPGLVLHASGCLLAAGGGVLLLVEVRPRLRTVRVGAALALLLGGFAAALVGSAPALAPPTTAAYPVSAFAIGAVAFAANAGLRDARLVAALVLVVGAEAIRAALGPRLGLRWALDVPTLAVLVLVVVASVALRPTAARVRDSRRAAEEAADQELLTRTRAVARSRTAAVVHDTVLGDLAALAAARPGPLRPEAAAGLRRTTSVLRTADWAIGTSTGPLPGGAFLAAVGRAERAGLRVRLDGDLGLLGALPPGADRALAQATEQCLTNTLRHAGVDQAEVTVLGDAAAVTVMVADTGSGFDPAAVDPSRIGLSTAVAGRVEAVGGSARVFARPGVGTTVLLTVPRAAER